MGDAHASIGGRYAAFFRGLENFSSSTSVAERVEVLPIRVKGLESETANGPQRKSFVVNRQMQIFPPRQTMQHFAIACSTSNQNWCQLPGLGSKAQQSETKSRRHDT